MGFKFFNDELKVYGESNTEEDGVGGFYKHKKGAETHVTSPKTVLKLQKAVRSGNLEDWNEYMSTLENRSDVQLRDLFTLPTTLKHNREFDDEVLSDIFSKFTVSSMSLGALSEEAHQALAEAMNEIGGKSGSVKVVKIHLDMEQIKTLK